MAAMERDMDPGYPFKQFLQICCIGLISLAWTRPSAAVDVYQWVDENGVTHFSQFAPADTAAEVNKRTLIDEAPTVEPEEDRYAVEQTAKDMQAYRDELDEKREQRRQQQANAPQPIVVQHYNDSGYPYYLNRYPNRPVRPPDWRPGNGPGNRPGNGPGSGPRPTPMPQPPASSGFRKPGG